jgi:hypothetical protein
MTSVNAPKENFDTMYQTILIGARIRSLMLGHYRYLTGKGSCATMRNRA